MLNTPDTQIKLAENCGTSYYTLIIIIFFFFHQSFLTYKIYLSTPLTSPLPCDLFYSVDFAQPWHAMSKQKLQINSCGCFGTLFVSLHHEKKKKSTWNSHSFILHSRVPYLAESEKPARKSKGMTELYSLCNMNKK